MTAAERRPQLPSHLQPRPEDKAQAKQLRIVHGEGETVYRDNPQIDFQDGALLIFEDRAKTVFLAGYSAAAWGMFYVEDQES